MTPQGLVGSAVSLDLAPLTVFETAEAEIAPFYNKTGSYNS
ncbi:MAG: hypothetical protein H6Q43_1470 [Deltaproteobacteria bacterium]|nr:hypothetical protein [Deltaproteobacteria bacterium]